MRSGYPPISRYALLSDCHSAALVSLDGSIDWCCFRRFDAPPVFARLLDWNRGGYFRVAPTGRYSAIRRYLPGTNVLETRFLTDSGMVWVLDCLAVRRGATVGDATRTRHQLLRLVYCTSGQVEVRVEFVPRFDYGLTTPRLELDGDDVGVVDGGADALVLQSAIPINRVGIRGCGGTATMRAGEHSFLALTHQPPHQLQVQRLSLDEVAGRIQCTIGFWEAWSRRCAYDGPYREQVLRSALVLKALSNAPTGAIVAAPTTSLPQRAGGGRNRDHRYSWLRQAPLNLSALFTLGYTREAHHLMRWLERTTAGSAQELKSAYGVGGERLLPEVELTALDGYRASRPVRIGSAADHFRLDRYGYLLDTAWVYHRHGGDITAAFWRFLSDVVGVVAARWAQPDEGTWGGHGGRRRHLVYSKVLAWVAVDRGIRLAQARGLPADLDCWKAVRLAIRRRVEQDGTDPTTGAFVQSFGTRAVDASNLLLPLVRFLPPHDPRVRATLERTLEELTPQGLAHRHPNTDGLSAEEASSLICSFWLVDNLALAGRTSQARELFDRLLGFANDVGLLAEEIDPTTAEQLGNFPQAFSHAGLIGAAITLQRGAPPAP